MEREKEKTKKILELRGNLIEFWKIYGQKWIWWTTYG